MIPELGQYALILALLISVLLAIVPMAGAATHNRLWMSYARPLSKAQFVFLLISFLCLVYSFVVDDFSVAYVANNSNSALPVYYKISAVWGGHEGSLLLWVLIMGGWTLAVAVKSDDLPLVIVSRVLSVMGLIGIGFILFTLITSSPFTRYLPNAPQQGADLNPLLQDIGLILHPPMLYMGYVGFSVAFAFAIAALMTGKLDAAWARWSRPWTNIAWAFLTLGIALGSWWAYYELGWGGWWFWDPVENASFMPWLVGTALVHSLAVTEKRGVFKSWTVLLAIFAFSLSLLGTFLVRSGVLTSVHAFATDPERGFFILALLGITIGGSFLLYAVKAAHVKSESSFELLSRETLLLMNNIILTVSCLMVLIGTLYPLFMDAFDLGKMSVGPPYFNAMFIPLMSLMIMLLSIGIISRWKRTPGSFLISQLAVPMGAAIAAAIATPFVYDGEFHLVIAGSMLLVFWVSFASLRDLANKLKNKSSLIAGLRGLSRSYYSMHIAHIGVVITVVGIAMVSIYEEDRDLRMEPGQSLKFKHYEFVFDGARHLEGPNWESEQARVRVFLDGEPYDVLYPEKRKYNASGTVMTEAAIDPGWTRDIYVALGEPLGNGAWAVRIQHKPFVRWIWLGGLFMTVAGLLSASDRRYRRQKARQKQQQKQVAA